MSKKYFVFSDQIKATPVENGTDAFSTGGAYTELNKKFNKSGYDVGDKGKVATVKEISTGVYELSLETPAAQTKADWNETDTSKAAYIQNKPFQAIGTGLSVVDVTESGTTVKKLQANTQFQFQVFTTLPAASATYAQIIALILKSTSETGNVYNEYGCVNTGTTEAPVWQWEQIGDLKVTVSQTTSEIKVGGTTLQTASDAQIGLMSAADHQDMQVKTNKVTTIAAKASASDDKYPSEKATATALEGKQDSNKLVTAWQGTVDDIHYPSEKLVKTSLDGKVAIDSASSPAYSNGLKIGRDSAGVYLEDGA